MVTIILVCALPLAILVGFLLGRWSTLKMRRLLAVDVLNNQSLIAAQDTYIGALKSLVVGKDSQIEGLTKLAQAQKQLLFDLHPEIEGIIRKAKLSLN